AADGDGDRGGGAGDSDLRVVQGVADGGGEDCVRVGLPGLGGAAVEPGGLGGAVGGVVRAERGHPPHDHLHADQQRGQHEGGVAGDLDGDRAPVTAAPQPYLELPQDCHGPAVNPMEYDSELKNAFRSSRKMTPTAPTMTMNAATQS